MGKKGFTLIELLIVIFIIAILAAMFFGGGKGFGCVAGCMPDYSEGDKEGYIVGLAQKGFKYKTWEGQLQLGVGKQAALQKPWNFSVPDSKVLEDVQKAKGKHVRLHYRKWLIRPMLEMESPYEITKVEVLE